MYLCEHQVPNLVFFNYYEVHSNSLQSSCLTLLAHTSGVTIPPLDPSARDEKEPDYDEEAQVWAAAMEHAAEVEDEETPDEYDWQISRLVSAATYTAGPDAGRVSTGRMKIT